MDLSKLEQMILENQPITLEVLMSVFPLFFQLLYALGIAVIVLIIVRIVHGRVTGRYTRIKGLEGLVDEEKRVKALNAERNMLEESIRAHEQIITREKELQAVIRKLAG